jgi:hypothetical protein
MVGPAPLDDSHGQVNHVKYMNHVGALLQEYLLEGVLCALEAIGLVHACESEMVHVAIHRESVELTLVKGPVFLRALTRASREDDDLVIPAAQCSG